MSKPKKKPRPRSVEKKLLNPRLLAFHELYNNPESPLCGNAAACAKELGFAEGKPGSSQIRGAGYRLAHHPDIVNERLAAMDRAGATVEEGAKVIARAMRATEVRLIPDENGNEVPTKVPLHDTQLQGLDRANRVWEAKARQSASARSSPVILTTPEGLPVETQSQAEPNNLQAEIAQLKPQDRRGLLSISNKVLAFAKLGQTTNEHTEPDAGAASSEQGGADGASGKAPGTRSSET